MGKSGRIARHVAFSHRAQKGSAPLPFVVLCLQGGGARAAFQVGAYKALEDLQIDVNWVVGVSSGAVNAAVIAGNPAGKRMAQLEKLWRVLWRAPNDVSLQAQSFDESRFWKTAQAMMLMFGKPNLYSLDGLSAFFNPFFATGFYNQNELRRALPEVIDFHTLNQGGARFSAGCANVCTSDLRFFDNRHDIVFSPGQGAMQWAGVNVVDREVGGQPSPKRDATRRPGPTTITADHIVAASAYPPGAQAVAIGSDLWWDAGVVANSPLEAIIEDVIYEDPGHILLILVDLWNTNAKAPRNIMETMWRKVELEHVAQIPSALTRMQLAFPNHVTADVLHLTYAYDKEVLGIDTVDFSGASTDDRIELGFRFTREALRDWQESAVAAEQYATAVHRYHKGKLQHRDMVSTPARRASMTGLTPDRD